MVDRQEVDRECVCRVVSEPCFFDVVLWADCDNQRHGLVLGTHWYFSHRSGLSPYRPSSLSTSHPKVILLSDYAHKRRPHVLEPRLRKKCGNIGGGSDVRCKGAAAA